ncbi:MAG: hypothetical protein AABY95_07595 [Pseudomonadota bacterium]
MPRELTLFESATGSLRISKHGRLMQIVADGNGACVVMDTEYNVAAKWASSRASAGSPGNDRSKFLDQIATLIARPGSFVSTRGSDKPLEDIVRLMLNSGFDINDWGMPPSVKALFSKGPATKPKTPPPSAPPESEQSPLS